MEKRIYVWRHTVEGATMIIEATAADPITAAAKATMTLRALAHNPSKWTLISVDKAMTESAEDAA